MMQSMQCGQPLLHYTMAWGLGHVEVVNLLLAAGAAVDAPGKVRLHD
jgi:hypothetical protein